MVGNNHGSFSEYFDLYSVKLGYGLGVVGSKWWNLHKTNMVSIVTQNKFYAVAYGCFNQIRDKTTLVTYGI